MVGRVKDGRTSRKKMREEGHFPLSTKLHVKDSGPTPILVAILRASEGAIVLENT